MTFYYYEYFLHYSTTNHLERNCHQQRFKKICFKNICQSCSHHHRNLFSFELSPTATATLVLQACLSPEGVRLPGQCGLIGNGAMSFSPSSWESHIGAILASVASWRWCHYGVNVMRRLPSFLPKVALWSC